MRTLMGDKDRVLCPVAKIEVYYAGNRENAP